MRQIDPKTLAERLCTRPMPVLLDVREDWERQIAHIEGDRHIPMNAIPERFDELDAEQELVVYCHHGARSAKVVEYLTNKGFVHAVNLEGGIDAWARTVQPELARY